MSGMLSEGAETISVLARVSDVIRTSVRMPELSRRWPCPSTSTNCSMLERWLPVRAACVVAAAPGAAPACAVIWVWMASLKVRARSAASVWLSLKTRSSLTASLSGVSIFAIMAATSARSRGAAWTTRAFERRSEVTRTTGPNPPRSV